MGLKAQNSLASRKKFIRKEKRLCIRSHPIEGGNRPQVRLLLLPVLGLVSMCPDQIGYDLSSQRDLVCAFFQKLFVANGKFGQSTLHRSARYERVCHDKSNYV